MYLENHDSLAVGDERRKKTKGIEEDNNL